MILAVYICLLSCRASFPLPQLHSKICWGCFQLHHTNKAIKNTMKLILRIKQQLIMGSFKLNHTVYNTTERESNISDQLLIKVHPLAINQFTTHQIVGGKNPIFTISSLICITLLANSHNCFFHFQS